MSRERTAPFDQMLDAVAWTPILGVEGWKSDALPYATHTGLLRVADLELPVVQLSTGERVVTEDGMRIFLAWLGADLP